MELEHAFQQSGFMAALQLLIAGSLLAPEALGSSALRRFVAIAATHIVSFGPMALLVYVLYRVSHLC